MLTEHLNPCMRTPLITSSTWRPFAIAKTRQEKDYGDFHSSNPIAYVLNGSALHFTAHFKDEGSLLLLANFKGPVRLPPIHDLPIEGD